jgi:propionyl-CoA carboxylase beta chain
LIKIVRYKSINYGSKIKELNDKIAQAHLGGGKTECKNNTKKKLTARER